ncbi:MAG TPA: hypothetical protein DCW49_04860 [Alteromonas australica]|nr:hypothetical protein [Alteromonas australica]
MLFAATVTVWLSPISHLSHVWRLRSALLFSFDPVTTLNLNSVCHLQSV